MTDTESDTSGSGDGSGDPEPEPSSSEGPDTGDIEGEVSLQEIVTDMPETLGEDGVKQAILKLGMVFATVAVGFLFIILAFGASLMRMESGDGAEALADIGLFVQLALAMFGAMLIALLNPVLLAGVIGFETANKIDEVKPAVTTATVGCAVGVVGLVLILVVGSVVGFAVIVPDSAQEIDGANDGPATSDDPYAEAGSSAEEEEGGLQATDGLLLLLFSGLVGGIAGGGGAYATKKYGGAALVE